MNFKEIRLVGFKSFADKTSIKFDDGVTCIVGPNGCGKSNVADAVRWVLGEQSAKTLRGSNMQDVIFNGTETRRQLSYCEVTLVFDNADKIFDIEYDEVAMTRRLYRSGESEYLLNMQPCRMKDIVALLHGVGIGKEGYSIIGQGKVTQIMTSKPEDRRSIFEEATGVIKFKTQKGEIERKLDVSREKLSVYVQRMDETEKQLHSLEGKAETTRKYREYAAQLKYEEINAFLVRSETFEQETEKYRSRIRTAEKELEEINGRLSLVDAESEEGKAKIAEADEELRSLNEKLRYFEVGIERKSGEGKVLNERIQSFHRQLKQATDDVAYSRHRMQDIERLVAESAKRTAESEKRAREIEGECASLTKRLNEAIARIAAYERISDERRAKEISSVEDLADLRANAGSLSARRDAAQDRVAEVRLAIRKAEEQKKEYVSRLEECRKEKKAVEAFLDARPAAEEELDSRIKDLALSEKRCNEEIAACNVSIANYTNKLQFYLEAKNRFVGYRESVRRLQLDAKKDPTLQRLIRGTIADLIATDKQFEVAIETCFGAAMQNIVTATQDDARRVIEYLKRAGIGRVTFLPVSSMRPRQDSREIRRALSEEGAMGLAIDLVTYDEYYDNVIRSFLGNTLVCDNLHNATEISKRHPNEFIIVTLDGDFFSTSGSMTGGARQQGSGALLAEERNIKECEESIEKKKGVLQKLQKALEGCSAELEEARAEYERFRVRVQEETANFAALAQKEIALSNILDDAESRRSEYTGLLERLTASVDELESKVLSTSESEDLLNRIREEAASEAQMQEERIGELNAERETLSAKLQDLRLESAGISSAQAAETENVARLTTEKATLLRKVEETGLEMEKTRIAIADLEREEARAALTEEEQRTVDTLRSRLDEVEKRKKKIGEEQQKREEEKRILNARQIVTTEEKHNAEIEISRAETNLENMRVRLKEQYDLEYEAARELRDPNYDGSQATSTINSLRHKIAALGDINHTAVEDYEELLAYYTDMQTQKEDVEKGIADLTNVLNNLRDEMQQQFDRGFNEINTNFREIFKELFGGGRAEMELDYTDCDDPLDAGVEIVACPPGKKLTKISLLSGGEQAFTAIAILFAILKSRPMPFCILDEIEAALDDANVDRFAKYLKKFSSDTQFIVITHRKPTMNQADTLFGVTMEEKGVSKIVSVKLSEVESRLGGDTVQ